MQSARFSFEPSQTIIFLQWMTIQTEKSLTNLLRVIRLRENPSQSTSFTISQQDMQVFPEYEFSQDFHSAVENMFTRRSNFALIIKVNTILFRVFSSLQTGHPHIFSLTHAQRKKNHWEKWRVQRIREKNLALFTSFMFLSRPREQR